MASNSATERTELPEGLGDLTCNTPVASVLAPVADEAPARPGAPDSSTAGVFCLLPWTSLHVATNGDALPCCIGLPDQPLGSTRTQSLAEIWNGSPLRDLRLRMLAGTHSRVCQQCYEKERSGFESLRVTANAEFGRHAAFVAETAADGSLPRVNMAFLDVRFSNVCNFSCRTCGPSYSTGWYRYGENVPSGVGSRQADGAGLLPQVEPLLDRVEQIYFAGGEPTLMREHYEILDRLIAIGRTDVRLSYSTNFSTFAFDRWNVLDLWRRFPHVSVGASLDGRGRRGEYLRAGQRWDRVVEMRRRQVAECPHVTFMVTATLSNLNGLHLPDCHDEWVAEGLIEPWQVHVNLLQVPAHFRLTSLPAPLKARVRMRYDLHLRALTAQGTDERVVRAYAAAVRFMDSEDTTETLPELRRVIRQQDRLRGESFEEVFPELRDLLEPGPAGLECEPPERESMKGPESGGC